jgi:hypothetical protein
VIDVYRHPSSGQMGAEHYTEPQANIYQTTWYDIPVKKSKK